MLLKNFLISNVIFTRRAIFSTLYVGKSSGKQDHYDVRGYCMACHIKNLLEFKKCILDISWILVWLDLSQLCSEDMMGLLQFEAALATPQFGYEV